MADMNGWKLVRMGQYVAHFFHCLNGMVHYKPDRKYRVDKRSAFDPTVRILRGEYREDTFELEGILLPDQYETLVNYLMGDGQMYLEYTAHPGKNVQFPVRVTRMPEQPDDLHEYPEAVKFTLQSSYIGAPTYVNPDLQSFEDQHEIVITN
ncbi:MAG: hypothetical protein GX294_00270 [Candidatus Cloacimonetes bacterium]|nr:hypothetical protein [Candidatus Cloacimonadota bacterium]